MNLILFVLTFTQNKAKDKLKFESEFDFAPRSFFFSEDFDWREFLARVDEVRALVHNHIKFSSINSESV